MLPPIGSRALGLGQTPGQLHPVVFLYCQAQWWLKYCLSSAPLWLGPHLTPPMLGTPTPKAGGLHLRPVASLSPCLSLS